MTEILTESFCERCGTRYTFESARSRTRLTGVRTLSRGLKNFVLSDDTSMDEAMAAARSETEREVTAHQLDAFHKTFTFCMSCRQYTCPNCWNEAEARCLTCAPHLGPQDMPTPFEESPGGEAPAAAAATLVADPWGLNGANGSHEDTDAFDGFALAEAEAAVDLGLEDQVDAATRLAALTTMPSAVEAPVVEGAPEPAQVAAETEAVVDAVVEEPAVIVEEPAVGPVAAGSAATETDAPAEAPAETGDIDLADIAAAAIVADAVTAEPPAQAPAAGAKPARRGAALRRRFRPGQDLDAELEAYEREQAAAMAAAAAAGPVVPAEVEPEAVVAAEPEVVAAEPEVVAAEPEVVAAEPEVVAAEPEVVVEAEVVAAEPEVVAAEPEVVAAEPEVVAEAVAAPEAVVAEPEIEAEAVVAEPEIEAEAEAEAVAAVQPTVDRDADMAAEPELAAAAIAAGTATDATTEPDAPSDNDLAAAALAAAALAAAGPATEPAPVDVIPQPTWRLVAPDATADTTPVAPSDPLAMPAAASAEPTGEPQWPARPEWLGDRPAVGLPFLGRPAAPTGGLDALWAESTRVVAGLTPERAATGVQPCVSCGLSLSATARFCRRCGTAQAG